MFLIAMMLAGQQAVSPPQPADAPPQAEVVITGNRMRDALDKCLARNCPPEEEVDAAMNAGAESFAAGRYEEAKRTLQRTIARNRKYAGRMPGRVSDLYATYADVTEHEGDKDAFMHATRESVYVLRRELGEGHPASVGVSARIGDMWVKLDKPDAADGAWRGAAEDAARAGRSDIAGALTFRRAWLALSTGNYADARRLVEQVERGHGRDPLFVPFLRVLKARIAIGDGKEEGTDALVAALRGTGGADPVLVTAPPYPVIDTELGSGMSSTGGVDLASAQVSQLLARNDIRWADIGFWVRPDGRTAEAQILRPARNSQWARPLLKQIADRRYALANSGPGGIGVYRVERFTLRADYGVETGSRIRKRTGATTLHVIDLTRLSARDEASVQP
ncbi:MAG TPA: hypothetical protein VLG14_13880 [Sphingomonas sp.]|jgi:hypothetical protein|nr:hypothetical protein [Sphingomonas sp.]